MNRRIERLDEVAADAAPAAVEDRLYAEILELRRAGQAGALATVIGVTGSSPAQEPMKILVRGDGTTLGSVGGGCLEEEVKNLAAQVIGEDRPARFAMDLTAEDTPGGSLICGGRVEVYVEPIGAPPLILFGGGHVSLAVARLAARAGFRLLVTDDRPTYASRERFPMAAETLAEFPEKAAAEVPVDARSYVLVMTRSHDEDRRILAALHRRGARPRYLGMIGSGTKVRLTFEALEAEGVDRAWLRRISAPVGLRIGARTADEIAVSVVAEMIAVRRGKPQGRWDRTEDAGSTEPPVP